ncbi:MAG: UbiA family prenyltransferase [Bacteroidales bacterium]|nr:UbiA family prenyltransferase [Bacteroidales bacterium]
MQKIKLWFGICRPRTLFASVCPVLMGLIAIQSVVDAWVALATLLCALSLQILSNLINDYYDFKRGSDKAGRVGPARALAEGLVDEKQMRNACLIAVGMSVALGLYLVVEGLGYLGHWCAGHPLCLALYRHPPFAVVSGYCRHLLFPVLRADCLCGHGILAGRLLFLDGISAGLCVWMYSCLCVGYQ